jgi:L-threonylcarbamoyladenylate synthase
VNNAKVISVDPHHPDERAIAAAARVIKDGGLVAYPTETYYGLGADALNHEAVEKVFRAKGRDLGKAITVIIDRAGSLPVLAAEAPFVVERLMERFWPGPLTIVLRVSEKVPALLSAGGGKIGVRVPSSAVARALAFKSGCPITATSANPSGGPGLTRAEAVSAEMGCEIDMVLDGGETPGPPASTILDATVSPPAMIREGAVSKRMIEDFLKLKVSTSG